MFEVFGLGRLVFNNGFKLSRRKTRKYLIFWKKDAIFVVLE
jgi:hypothetical protein